ncbi:MAG TPA: hypothetical protein VGO82_09090 [Enterovirga sp.]|nr:hypothetical protein [Enterovirga sp.]
MGDIGHQLPPEAVLLGEGPGNAAEDVPESQGERQDQSDRHRRDSEHLLRRPPELRDESAGTDGGEGDQGSEGAAHATDEGMRAAVSSAAAREGRPVSVDPRRRAVSPHSSTSL